MPNIVTIYHSGYGHTKKQAEAIHQSIASTAGITAHLLVINAEGNLEEQDWATLDQAQTIVFGSPTYMGCVSWQFKKFADATSKAWMQQKWKNKLAAGFTNSASMNGDKLSTLHYLFTLAMQHSMLWVGTGLLPSSSKSAARNDVNYLGSFAGLMAQSPADASPEEGPVPGDLATAKIFGTRISETTLKLFKS